MYRRTEILIAFASVIFCFALGQAQQPNTDAIRWRYIGPVGNRTTSVVGVPGQPYIYYAGSASGGIFKTTDGGKSWHKVFTHDGGRGFVWKVFPINTKLIFASPAQAAGDTGLRGTVSAGPCGGTPEGSVCSAGNDTSHVHVLTYDAAGSPADHAFYVAVVG